MKQLIIILGILVSFSYSNAYSQKMTLAIINNDIAKVKKLIEKGENINEHKEYYCFPLMYAVLNKNLTMVEFLMKNGAKSEICPATSKANHTAFYSKSNDLLDVFQQSPFYVAIKLNQLEMLKLFINYNYDITKKFNDPAFTYPIIVSSAYGAKEIFNFLVDKGVDVIVKDFIGNTPLMYSCLNNNLEMINILLKKGSSVNDTSKNGLTPLMYASQIIGLNVNIIDTLLKKGADVNYRNVKNQTAFSIACKHNNNAAAFFLLENGAKSNFSEVDIETNARMNFFLGEYYSLFKGDAASAKPYYEKATPLFKSSLEVIKKDLSKINTIKAGNILLSIGMMVATPIVSGGGYIYTPEINYNSHRIDKNNNLINDYQISDKASINEQKEFCLNKKKQFELSIKLIEGKLACIAKGLTGQDLENCFTNIQLSKE